MTFSDACSRLILKGLVGSSEPDNNVNIYKVASNLYNLISEFENKFLWLSHGDYKGKYLLSSADLSFPSGITFFGDCFRLHVMSSAVGTYGQIGNFHYPFMVYDSFGNTEFWDGSDKWIPSHEGVYFFVYLGYVN